jgi:nucleoside-diphosphate-sugar epimerase
MTSPSKLSTIPFSENIRAHLLNTEHPIIVTGGSGWIGRSAISMLQDALGETFTSRVKVFCSSEKSFIVDGARVHAQPLSELNAHRVSKGLLLHFAYLTREKSSLMPLQDYVKINSVISNFVFDFADKSKIGGLFMPSSGAVYKADKTLEDNVTTNPYGFLKAQDEKLFTELSTDKKVIPRLFNLSGPFITKPQNYALGSIVTDIIKGGPIVINSDRPVIRSYVHVRDLVNLAFAILLGMAPPPSSPFDTAGANNIEIGDLAVLSKTVLGYPNIKVNRPPLDSSKEPDVYVGNGELYKVLISSAKISPSGIEKEITDTADYLRKSDQ